MTWCNCVPKQSCDFINLDFSIADFEKIVMLRNFLMQFNHNFALPK